MSVDRLLRRKAPQGYLEEWELSISTPQEQRQNPLHTAMIFKLKTLYLALPITFIAEVSALRTVHNTPHQKERGLINAYGRLRSVISLVDLLEIDSEEKQFEEKFFILLKREESIWAFAVSEICGIHHYRVLEKAPIRAVKTSYSHFKGIVTWQKQSVAFIDEDLLFSTLGSTSL